MLTVNQNSMFGTTQNSADYAVGVAVALRVNPVPPNLVYLNVC